MRLRTYIFAVTMAFVLAATLHMSAGEPQSANKPGTWSRVRIEVTGGDSNVPVDNASVYLKFRDDAKKQKGKTNEQDLKTNQQGVARADDVPQGKILIQIVAEGWKPYGEWHDVDQDEQTIQVHLDRPPKLHP
jgi:hypothetical protein